MRGGGGGGEETSAHARLCFVGIVEVLAHYVRDVGIMVVVILLVNIPPREPLLVLLPLL